ncbi:MAG: hypothetical protein IPM29_10295 [Planctomycetes bacterium]|nr:hypothetical protein [Planctomycetota bacterium]
MLDNAKPIKRRENRPMTTAAHQQNSRPRIVVTGAHRTHKPPPSARR